MKIPILSLTAGVFSLVAATQAARAATGADTWQGSSGSTDWATSGNWTTGSANKPPISGDSLTFGSANASTTATLTNSLTTQAFNINGITFSSGAVAYTMTGATFTLTAGVTNSSTALETFNNTGGLFLNSGTSTWTAGGGIAIANGLTNSATASGTITVNGTSAGAWTLGSLVLNAGSGTTETLNGSGTVNITGAVANGGGNNNLTYSGTGTLNLGGTNTYSGTTTVSGGVVITAGTNTSAGGTTVTSGTLQLDNASNGGLASGTLTLNGGTVQSLFSTPTVSSPVALNASSTVSGANSITVSGTLTQGASSTLTSSITGGANTLTLGAVNIDSVTGTTQTLTLAGTGNTTISGVIEDYSGGAGSAHGALTITNTGVTTLGGANTYGGLTTISTTGTVVLSGSNSSAGATTLTTGVLQLDNATSGVNGGLASGTLTLGGGTLQSLVSNPTVTNIVTASASSTVSGSSAINMTGTLTQTASTTLTNNNGGTLTLGGTVNIDSVIGTAQTLTLAGTGNTTISGVIEDYSGGVGSSHGALTIANTGVTTLSNANTFGGTFTLNNGTGTLEIDNAAALGANTSVFTITGGNIDNNTSGAITDSNNNAVKINGNFGFVGTQNLNLGTGTVTFGAVPTITVSSGTLTFGGVISNSSVDGLTKAGAGTLYFSNSTVSTSTTNILGAVTVNAGALEINNTGLLTKSVVTLNSTNGLMFAAPSLGTYNVLSLNGNGNQVLQDTSGNAVTLDIVNFDQNANGTYGGILSGSGGITKIASIQFGNSSGVETFTGANTFTGTTTINGGVINYQNGTAFGTYSPIVVTVGSGGGGAVQVQGGIAGGSETLTLASSGVQNGANGALENVSGNNSYAGNIVLTSSSAIQSDSGALTLNGNLTNTAASGTVTLVLQGASTSANTITGTISDGSTALTGVSKTGPGTWILAGGNTYSGPTTISGGVLQMNNNTALGAGTVTVNTANGLAFGTVLSGAASIGNLAGTGNFVLQDTANNAVTLSVSSTGTTTYSGAMSGSGALTQNGSGVLVLSGADSFTGATTINNGDIDYQNSTAFGSSAITTAGGAIQVQGGITGGAATITLGSPTVTTGAIENVSGNNSYAGNIVLSGTSYIASDSGTLTLLGGISGTGFLKPTGLGTVVLDGAITSTGALQKNNTGTLVLAGANTYVGATSFANTSAGAIDFENDTAFGTNSVITESTWSSGVGDTVQVQGGIAGGSMAMTLSGPGASGSTGALENISGSNSYAGAITINAPTTLSADSGMLTLTGGLNPVASTNTLTFTGAGNYVISTTGIGGGMPVIKSGTGTLMLSAANSFTGGITINNGVLDLQGGVGSLVGTNALTFGSGAAPTFDFDNTNATGAVTQTMGALSAAASTSGGEGTVLSNMGGATTSTLTFSSLATRNLGATLNFVTTGGTNGAAGVPGTNVINFTTSPATGFINAGYYFNGSNYAFYDTTGSTKFVRGINYGVDAGSALSGAGTTLSSSLTGTLTSTSNVEIMGNITADSTGTIKTLQIGGAYNYTQNSNTLTLAGMLKSGGGSSTVSGGSLTSGGTADLQVRTAGATDTLTIADNITSTTTGGLTASGLGTLILTGSNAYTGNTYINGGTLQIGNGGSTGNVNNAGTIVDLGALVYDTTGTATLTNTLSGTGSVTVAAGKVVLAGTESYTGQTTINSGATLQVGNGTSTNNISTTNNITDNGTLAWDLGSGTSTSYSGILSGTGGLSILTNTTTLTGANTITGATTIASGAGLVIGTGGALSSSTIADNGLLSVSSSGTVVLPGVISGTGTFTQWAGTVYVGSTNSYTGGGNLSGGTMIVAANNALGTGTYTLADTIQTDGGTRTLANPLIATGENFGNGGNLILTGTLTDGTSGSFNMKNAETTSLGQINLATGVTLIINPAYGGGMSIFNGITGTGTGHIAVTYDATASTVDLAGSNTFGSGVTLSGIASGYLMLGNDNALGGTSFTFNSSNGVPAQIILMEAAPTSSEALSVGSLTGQKITTGAVSVSTVAGLAGSNNLEFDIPIAGSLNNQSTGTTIFTSTAPTGIGGNGSGAVILSSTSTGSSFSWGDGNSTVTLSGANTGGLGLTGGTAILDTGNTNAHVAATATLSLAGVNLELENVSNASSNVNQTAAATVINTGETVVSQVGSTGTLVMGALSQGGSPSGSGSQGYPGAIGGSGDLDLAAAGIATTTTTNTNGILMPGTVVVGTANSADWGAVTSGVIGAYSAYTSFPGGSSTGTATVNYLLNGSGSTTGSFTAQTMKIASSAASQSLALGGALTFNTAANSGGSGGILYVGSNNYSITGGSIGNANGTLTFQQFGTGNLTISSAIGSPTTTYLVKAGPGTLTLASTANTYTGMTVVNSGVLAISSDSNLNPISTGTLNNPATSNTASSVVNLANQGVGPSTGFTIGAIVLGQQVTGISNSGNTLFLSGNANAVVTNTNVTYINDPGIILDGGTLQATTTFNLGSQIGGTGPIYGRSIMLGTQDGAIDVTAGNTLTVSGVIYGSGALTKIDTGTLLLTNGSNNYVGGTIVTGGTLAFGVSNSLNNATTGGTLQEALTSPVLVNGGTIDLLGTTQDFGPLTLSSGTIADSTGGGLINAYSYALQSGTVGAVLGDSAARNSGAGVSLSAALTKSTNGTVILTGNNVYTGATIITGGVLQVGNNTTTGSLGATSDVSMTGGTLAFDRSNADAVSNVISGAGNVAQMGSGTLTLTGSNSFTGTVAVNAGTLAVGTLVTGTLTDQPLGDGTLVTLGVASGSSGLLQYTGAGGTLDKNVTALGSGANTIQNAGAGLLTLTGTLTKTDTALVLNGGAGGILVNGVITNASGSNPNFDSDLYATGTVTIDNSNNNYSGPTHVFGGALLVNGLSGALPSSTVVELGNSDAIASETGASFTNVYELNGFNQSIAGLTSTNPVGFTDSNSVVGGAATTSTLTVTPSNSDTYSGVLGGSGTNQNNLAVIMGGAGTFSLTSANTYTGGTTINSGTLYANNASGSATGSGTIGVHSTGALAGSGSVAPVSSIGSAITVADGGNITPGGVQPAANYNWTANGGLGPNNPGNGNLSISSLGVTGGTLLSVGAGTVTNPSLTFALGNTVSGSTVTPSSSQIVVTGGNANTINFNANGTGNSVVSINDLVGASLQLNMAYTLIQGNNTTFEDNGSIWINSTSLGLTTLTTALPSNLAGNTVFQIDGGLSLLAPGTSGNFFSQWYGSSVLIFDQTTDSIDVEVVPEPSTWAMMIGGIAVLLFWQRRRQNKL